MICMIVVDAENAVVGRMAAKVAKLLLDGETVNVVNAEKAVMSGEPSMNVAKYKTRRLQKDKSNPEHSPYISRRPDIFVKRIVRGMLPFKTPRGRRAFKNLRIYSGIPQGLSVPKDSKVELKAKEKLNLRSISIAELCRQLGHMG